MDTDPATTPLSPDPANPLSVMQTGETTIAQIKRHPIGLVGTYVGALLILLLAATGLILLMPQLDTYASHAVVVELSVVGFGVLALFTGLFVLVATKIYWGNRWIITSDSITQLRQRSLFDTQSSQLSMANLEDVTAEQNGLLAHMLGYGTLRVETAGERSKFYFMYCPKPTYYAQQIIAAREQFEQRYSGNRMPGSL